MSAGIYIGSTTGYSGKNTVVMGLALRLQKEGFDIGYMKPVGAVPLEQDGVTGDGDAFFVQDILGLKEAADLVTPVVVTPEFKLRAFSGACPDFMPSIVSAYNQISARHDMTIVAGSGSMYSGRYSNLDGVRVVKELDLKAVIIDRMQKELNYDYLVVLKDSLGDNMAGVILNDIPQTHMQEVEGLIKPFLERNGVRVAGIIPKDPLMSSIKVGDLAERLNGRIVAAEAKSNKVVENFLIGTMQVENFMTHFRKNRNSAVIVGGDRSDVQLVALEGSCPCLVLTGNLYPNDIILTRAEKLNVPIIVVREDTYSVAKRMEAILTRHKLRDVIKIRQGAQLVSSALDIRFIKDIAGL